MRRVEVVIILIEPVSVEVRRALKDGHGMRGGGKAMSGSSNRHTCVHP